MNCIFGSEEKFTIHRIGEYAYMPVHKFLIYEARSAPASEADIFVLKIGEEVFGHIRRKDRARAVEWKPGVELTELDFFTVADDDGSDETCLRLDVVTDRGRSSHCNTAITIEAVYGGRTVKIPPTRVFAWCGKRRNTMLQMFQREIRETRKAIEALEQSIATHSADEYFCKSAQYDLQRKKSHLERVRAGNWSSVDDDGNIVQTVVFHRREFDETRQLAFYRNLFQARRIDKTLPGLDRSFTQGDYATIRVPKEAVEMIIENVQSPDSITWQKDSSVFISQNRSVTYGPDMCAVVSKVSDLAHELYAYPELLKSPNKRVDVHVCMFNDDPGSLSNCVLVIDPSVDAPVAV